MVQEITTTPEFQMSLLLFISLTGYLLALKINQSAVIGEILVGLIVGPSVLGLITFTDFVNSIAHLGAVILLFVVGLEFELKDIFNTKYAPIAFLGVLLPWIGGDLIAMYYGYNFATALFVGTALAATSVAITAEVLREMNLLTTPAAKAIIGAAVLDDILSLLALSVSTQLIDGELTGGVLLLTGIKAVAFLVIGVLLGSKVLAKYVVRIDRSELAQRYPEFIFIFAMTIAFFYSMFAELVGLSAIVGAFIAGISLEAIKNLEHSKDYKEGAEYLHIIFASIFFVSLGIIADANALNRETILFLVILTIIAIITKLIGCSLPAKIQGMDTKDSLIIGFGMVPRGEVAMIIALIGLNARILTQEIYVALVLMSLLTTVIPPIILRNWLLKS